MPPRMLTQHVTEYVDKIEKAKKKEVYQPKLEPQFSRMGKATERAFQSLNPKLVKTEVARFHYERLLNPSMRAQKEDFVDYELQKLKNEFLSNKAVDNTNVLAKGESSKPAATTHTKKHKKGTWIFKACDR